MKIGLIAPTATSQAPALERDAHHLARGLALRGAEVEILTQAPARGPEYSVLAKGLSVRRFPSPIGPMRCRFAPGLWDWLRTAADRYDLLDVHTRHAAVALAVTRTRVRRRVFTPHAPIHRLTRWPYTHATWTIVRSYAQIVCASPSERDLLCQRFPEATERTRVVPLAVDTAPIREAIPFEQLDGVVLVVGPLERSKRIDRVIAAMASLDSAFKLVVVGDGPARNSLRAYAADLRVSRRVEFVGSARNTDLYRWLRTARVVVDVADSHSFGSPISAAIVAGVPIVASDIRGHRETAAQFSSGRVIFVPPVGSPLQVSDGIAEASRFGRSRSASQAPSWEDVVGSTWDLYSELVAGRHLASVNGDSGTRSPSGSNPPWRTSNPQSRPDHQPAGLVR